ncbi:hypothetical protein EDB83DRAFT_2326740 [Lactarius deliciosus]|nr:hypothetical protein EDB83DRAFT_2326740 [Lactarius deliciosus]
MACRWWLGLACRVEAVWRVGGVLHVMLRRRGGSAGSWRAVMGQGGGLAVAVWWGRMEVAHVHEWPAISRVLHAVLGRRGGLVVAGCRGRMEVARMHEWPATSRVRMGEGLEREGLGRPDEGWKWEH